ncbi:twin-arginine translocase subunit TatC [Halobacteriovorax sp. GB3]|uniref:twin-arginine translocase subunit TatC n=1 Tax=Halobacteriovorax sp. GB3 TaxID=2719615 RepID=UPI00236197F7|nr:twin-arginine translocase subunit TatC [Halobacteriovorax sp. GB3]MDD0853510.1 twin-arginine translocase subunit TatC [Halobacteriovorax sp. GB3]
MTLVEHLEELRGRLIKVVIILTISFFVCYGVGDQISELLLQPLRNALSGSGKDALGEVVYLGILDKVLSQFQVAFWTSVIVSSPFWFYQLWKFIKPGLYEYEVKATRPFIFVGFIFFALGICFGYFLVFPLTFETLMNFGVSDVTAQISLKEYLVLTSKVLVFLGFLFQLPNVLLILGFMGLVTKQSLRNMRRYVYVGFAVISAVLTPPDIITMMGLWIPLTFLFEIGILAVSLIVHPYIERQHG